MFCRNVCHAIDFIGIEKESYAGNMEYILAAIRVQFKIVVTKTAYICEPDALYSIGKEFSHVAFMKR